MNPVVKLNCVLAYLLMSDNANLLDIEKNHRVRRFVINYVV